jgi:hypothetical protein
MYLKIIYRGILPTTKITDVKQRQNEKKSADINVYETDKIDFSLYIISQYGQIKFKHAFHFLRYMLCSRLYKTPKEAIRFEFHPLSPGLSP